MRKLVLALIMSATFMVGGAFSAPDADQQVRVDLRIGQDRNRRYRNRRGIRTQIIVRNVYRYGRLYRETYRVRYLPNGRVRSKLISRVLIRPRYYRHY